MPAPVNDDFANRVVLASTTSGSDGPYTIDLATTEVSEPCGSAFSPNLNQTVWWEWTAPIGAGGQLVSINTNASTVSDTTLAVWTGTPGAFGSFVEIASDDDGGTGAKSLATFSAVASTVYYIQVGCYSPTTGAVSIAWSTSAPATVDHLEFALQPSDWPTGSAQLVEVQALDVSDAAVLGALVTLTLASGPGSLTLTDTTDSSGLAYFVVNLGTSGTYRLRATSGSVTVNSVSFIIGTSTTVSADTLDDPWTKIGGDTDTMIFPSDKVQAFDSGFNLFGVHRIGACLGPDGQPWVMHLEALTAGNYGPYVHRWDGAAWQLVAGPAADGALASVDHTYDGREPITHTGGTTLAGNNPDTASFAHQLATDGVNVYAQAVEDIVLMTGGGVQYSEQQVVVWMWNGSTWAKTTVPLQNPGSYDGVNHRDPRLAASSGDVGHPVIVVEERDFQILGSLHSARTYAYRWDGAAWQMLSGAEIATYDTTYSISTTWGPAAGLQMDKNGLPMIFLKRPTATTHTADSRMVRYLHWNGSSFTDNGFDFNDLGIANGSDYIPANDYPGAYFNVGVSEQFGAGDNTHHIALSLTRVFGTADASDPTPLFGFSGFLFVLNSSTDTITPLLGDPYKSFIVKYTSNEAFFQPLVPDATRNLAWVAVAESFTYGGRIWQYDTQCARGFRQAAGIQSSDGGDSHAPEISGGGDLVTMIRFLRDPATGTFYAVAPWESGFPSYFFWTDDDGNADHATYSVVNAQGGYRFSGEVIRTSQTVDLSSAPYAVRIGMQSPATSFSSTISGTHVNVIAHVRVNSGSGTGYIGFYNIPGSGSALTTNPPPATSFQGYTTVPADNAWHTVTVVANYPVTTSKFAFAWGHSGGASMDVDWTGIENTVPADNGIRVYDFDVVTTRSCTVIVVVGGGLYAWHRF